MYILCAQQLKVRVCRPRPQAVLDAVRFLHEHRPCGGARRAAVTLATAATFRAACRAADNGSRSYKGIHLRGYPSLRQLLSIEGQARCPTSLGDPEPYNLLQLSQREGYEQQARHKRGRGPDTTSQLRQAGPASLRTLTHGHAHGGHGGTGPAFQVQTHLNSQAGWNTRDLSRL